MRWLSLLLLLSACGDDGPSAPAGEATGSTLVDTGVSLDVALTRRGFTVGEGAFVFSTMDACCEEGATCLGNNPSTPYGTPFLPPAPQGPVEDDELWAWGSGPEGLSRTVRLRADEAWLLVGEAPPDAQYLSYRSYVSTRHDEETGGRRGVIGSLGPSLNHSVMEAQLGRPVFGEPFAVITSFDPGVEEAVRGALIDAGWATEAIFTDRIPLEVVRTGLEEDADTFFGVMRSAIYTDPGAGEAYQSAPAVRLLRLTPETPLQVEGHSIPELLPRGSGTNEDAWKPALTALQDAVVAAFPTRLAVVQPAVAYWLETYECLEGEVNCTGDLRDRFTAITPPFTLGEDEAVVAIGVNHERTGKATYSSASIQTIQHQVGLQSFDSTRMPGSAAAWLADDPLADDLYAWVLARDCTGWPEPCFEVPLACVDDPTAEELKVTVRAYLEPTTGTAPMQTEMSIDRAIKLFPEGSAP